MRLVNLKGDDKLVSVEVVSEADLERYGTAEGEAPAAGDGAAVASTDSPAESAEETTPSADEPEVDDSEDTGDEEAS